MDNTDATPEPLDPFRTLGLPEDSTDARVRERYLQLVKQHPPERDPAKFQEIQAAYAIAKDPLARAEAMLQFPDPDAPPNWSDVIEAHISRPPAMSPAFVLSLGNRPEAPRDSAPDPPDLSSKAPSDA